MLKIWSMVCSPSVYGMVSFERFRTDFSTAQKQQQQAAANAEGGGQKKKKVTAAQLRVQKGKQLPARAESLTRRWR